ncbi:MAG TPA: MBL fold hydrolase [Candidatus Margulisbacteria bacterium]|nr:MAG: MBL fold hydrolase [Candidatus Margulisbacteria bacterium GWD2_39_127]OGI04980.1 MAG: MBL fold hydrolase [Candidatus Margulisbacteria bacterium GWF2_38_17]HAR64336.1 MBL fold hydrolase [Candidatus Margulisiibacteriota bacterium]
MAFPIKNNISWVGKIDWELDKFHGNEYSIHHGTSYNSYLIQEEKTVLIDTIWAPFSKEFVNKLAQTIDLKQIDYIIANHAEVDHSGALPELLKYIPDTPIYCTTNGSKSLYGHYHQNWNFKTVKTGDRLSLGKKELVFIEAPMLHWPDTMFSYLTEDNILFSNDAFGQHYASEFMYNDLVDQSELFAEAIKYYANILNPFSPMVIKKINEILAFNLPLDMICPSHGVIWRDNPISIVEDYLAWADNYQENQITIIYDTMWNGTRVMAENIAAGIKDADKDVTVKLYNVAKADKNDVVTEVFKSKAIIVGSPTINRGILTAVAGICEEIKGLGFKNKKAAAFGCYGWSGESTKVLVEILKSAGFEIADDGIKALWNPDDNAINSCIDYGRRLVGKF